MCKSGIQYESDSDSDEGGVYYSTMEKTNFRQPNLTPNVVKNGQSKISLTLNINQGLLTLCTPVRDSKRNVIPGQQGEILMQIEEATIFFVESFKGDENEGYICVLTKDCTLYHCGLFTMSPQTPPLRSVNSVIPKHCVRTIHRTESGANVFRNLTEKDALRVAVSIQAAQDYHRIKVNLDILIF